MFYNVPVLFVFFNRPDVAKTTFEKIKAQKPSKLYLASDGARENRAEEKLIVDELRNYIVASINWDCEVKTLFRDRNVGCSLGVKTAVDWMFEFEDMGIVLEDDCVVQDSFWPFMQELLLKFREDQRVGMIAGYNELGSVFSNDSYAFSVYRACWGWATWKRAWMNMDLEMRWRDSGQYRDVMMRTGYYGADIRETEFKILKIDHDLVSAWDWQWYSTLAAQNQLCIFPAVSLVSNIGFGENATHTTNVKAPENDAHYDLTFPLKHPTYIVPNERFDNAFHKKLYSWKRRIRNLLISNRMYLFLKGE